MLTKLAVSAYAGSIEIALWLFLGAGGIGGYYLGRSARGDDGALIGAGLGLLGAFILSVFFFGAHLILGDIRDAVRTIERNERRGSQPGPPSSWSSSRVVTSSPSTVIRRGSGVSRSLAQRGCRSPHRRGRPSDFIESSDLKVHCNWRALWETTGKVKS